MAEFCRQPFTAIEIDHKGDVYTCCPSFINFNKIGNIWENNLEEIWYGPFAKELRQKILNNDYSLCNIDICRQIQLRTPSDEFDYFDIHPKLPKYITLAYDTECNLACITCRDCKYKNSDEQLDLYNKKIDSLLLPLLKDAEIIALSGSGEALYSSHSRSLIKKLAEYNKNILFNINTNGILCNENNLKQLNIYGRINEIFVSLPAFNKNIYDEIVKGGNIDIVKKNIEWLAKYGHTDKKIKRITINMVISSLNYKEIIGMVKYAKDLDIWITISPFCHWGTQFGKDYNNVAVWEKENPNYDDFVSIIKNKLLDYDKCWMNPLFKDIRNN